MVDPMIPMEPVSRENLFQSEDWLYQVKWDGVRMLAYLEGAEIELFNRKQRRRTENYPEVVQAAATLSCSSAILDGEIVVMNQGKADFFQVLKRELISNRKKLSTLMRKIPVHYMVFDILSHNGESLMDQPLEERLQVLSHLIPTDSQVVNHRCESFDDGFGLWRFTGEKAWEGVVMKKRQGVYRPARKDPSWQKVKHFQKLTATMVGVFYSGSQVHSLLLGIKDEGRWIYIGRVGSGLKEEERRLLTDALSSLKREDPSVINPPTGRNPGVIWVEPILRVDVRYLEWTPQGTLRSPTVVGFRLPES